MTPIPKPIASPRKVRRYLMRSTKPIQRRTWLKRSAKPIPQRNVKRQARRLKEYRKHLGSPYWFAMRYAAFKRDGGLCQCPDCIEYRKVPECDADETTVVCWFDIRGRVHGFETHHTTYARFGRERLSDVLTTIPSHHRKLEALSGKRAKFLRGSP